MRHHVHARKIGRSPSYRIAMYRNLVTSLLENERIETTMAKAKEVRRLADRMITLGKRGDLHARRRALRVIRRREVAEKVFDEPPEVVEARDRQLLWDWREKVVDKGDDRNPQVECRKLTQDARDRAEEGRRGPGPKREGQVLEKFDPIRLGVMDGEDPPFA